MLQVINFHLYYKNNIKPWYFNLGVIFCIGGRGTNGDPFASVEFYSSFLNKWTKLSDMSTPRRHVGCISLKGTHLFIELIHIIIEF